MVHSNRFTICNRSSGIFWIAAEPEGEVVSLAAGEEVQVVEQFEKAPVTLYFEIDKNGLPGISVWPGDGNMRVEKDGINILEL